MESYSEYHTHPVFCRLWEIAHVYWALVQRAVGDSGIALNSSGQRAEDAGEALGEVLGDFMPRGARDDLEACQLSCATMGELALELALRRAPLTHDLLVQDWPASCLFMTAAGLSHTAFVGKAPRRKDGKLEYIVTTLAESWRSLLTLTEWCRRSRHAVLQALDSSLENAEVSL